MELWHMKRDLSDENYAKWMKEKEEKSTRMWASIRRVLKFCLIGLAIIVVGFIGIAVYVANNKGSTEKEENKITGEIILGECHSPNHMLLTVHNGASKTLAKARFNVIVTQPGESNNLMPSGHDTITSNTIIAPGQSSSKWCYPIPDVVVSACVDGCLYKAEVITYEVEFDKYPSLHAPLQKPAP